MQDITSELPALDPVQQRSEEVIISCRQPRKLLQQQQQHHQQQQQLPLLQQQQQLQQQPQQQQQQQQSLKQQNQKVITRSQSSKVIPEKHGATPQLKQQQSLPQPLQPPAGATSGAGGGAGAAGANGSLPHAASKSVSILVYKTLNTVFKSSRKIIVRVCEVASAKKSFTMFKFNKASAQNRAESRASAVTGHDQFVRPPVSDKKAKNIMKKLNKQNGLKRSNSAIEFDVSALTAANRRHLYSSNRSASSEQDNSDHSEHSEKSPLVSARLDNLARLFFSKSMPAETGSRDTIESVLTTRPNVKYQYSALDSGNGVVERSPRERANRERAVNAIQEWIQGTNGRYEVIAHLDEIGSRHGKNWFLVTDASVRTDRLMTLLPLPPDCVALEDLSASENPKSMLMELLGSLHHPYIYPVLDLGFLRTGSTNYACLMTPFNSRGSLKDLIYKAQWNEPWARKYTRKPNCLPVGQIQRLGRQILEALLFLKERGFPLHGHLHSGNVILQNGAARLSGLENGLLGLSSRINAVMWSRSTTEIENVDIICFGHLLYEMCTGQEMTTPKPSMRVLEMELEHYPQILDVLGLIFEPLTGVCPSVEELVLCDLFRSIDLRELRGPCFSTIKPCLSRSTLNLLHAVKKRQCASLGNSFSEASSPCTPPSTPRDRRSGISRTMDSFDISSDSEEGLLDEIVVGCNYRLQHSHSHSHSHSHRHSRHHQQQQQQQQCERMQYEQQLQIHSHHHDQHHNHQQHQQSNQQQQQQQQQYYASSSCYQSFPQYSPHRQQYHHYLPHHQQQHPYCVGCDNGSPSDDNSCCTQENQQEQHAVRCGGGGGGEVTAGVTAGTSRSTESSSSAVGATIATITTTTTINLEPNDDDDEAADEVSAASRGEQLQLEKENNERLTGQLEVEVCDSSSSESKNHKVCSSTAGNGSGTAQPQPQPQPQPQSHGHASSSGGCVGASLAGASFNHQLTTDMCNYKNSKSRRLEYSLKCLKYGRSNPSQDSAFGSLTDNDLSIGSSSFRISSFQSISSPIDEGVEDIIIATTTVGSSETCLELATIPRSMVSQDSAISSPCRELSPSNFLTIDDAMSASSSAGSSSSGSTGNVRPQQFPVSLSPKILVTATTNSSNSSLSSSSTALHQLQSQTPTQQSQQPQQQQFDPPKILVNDQNSIYTTSPSKRTGPVEVFSQKYRVSSFEDMSPQKRSASSASFCGTGCSGTGSSSGTTSDSRHLKHVNRMAFRSLEEERRIDSAFMPITDRTNSENRVNMQSEKYKKLTHASFRISKTASQMSVFDTSPCQMTSCSSPGSFTMLAGGQYPMELQRPATASGSTSSRQTMWRDSKFYRKTRIAKSNDSLLETSPNHAARLSPSSLRDNYNGGGSGGGLAVTTSFCVNPPHAGNGSDSGNGNSIGGRRYCSSKSEDLAETHDYLSVMDARKSYSERHLVTLTELKQTAINSTTTDDEPRCCLSEDELSFNDDNNPYGHHQHQYHSQYDQQQQQQQHNFQQQQHHQQQQQQQYNHQYHHHHHHHHRYQQQQQPPQQQQYFAKRPHPNQLSWSSCSINHLKTTNIKTTSLATLPCQQNLSSTSSTSTSSSCSANATANLSYSGIRPAAKRLQTFKSLDQALNTTDSSGAGEEDNSSPEDSPTYHQTLSAAELSKIFAMDDAQDNTCSEEKTPLLDSVEMSPISPTEPDADKPKSK